MTLLIAATQLDRTLDGIPIILLGTVGIIVALFWLFLPVVLLSKLNRIIRLLETIERNQEPPAGKPSTGAAWRYPKA